MHPPMIDLHPLRKFYQYIISFPNKNGNFDRIAVLFFWCYDERKDKTEGLSALVDDDW